MPRARLAALALPLMLLAAAPAGADSRLSFVDGDGDGLVYARMVNETPYVFGLAAGGFEPLLAPGEEATLLCPYATPVDYGLATRQGAGFLVLYSLREDNPAVSLFGRPNERATYWRGASIDWGLDCGGVTRLEAVSLGDGLRPVPAPGTAMLFLSGLVAMLAASRRSRGRGSKRLTA